MIRHTNPSPSPDDDREDHFTVPDPSHTLIKDLGMLTSTRLLGQFEHPKPRVDVPDVPDDEA